MEPIIKLSRVNHRGEKRILLHFDSNSEIIDQLKMIGGARWSRTLGGWHVPDNEEVLGDVLKRFRGLAIFDHSALSTGVSVVSSTQPSVTHRDKEAVPVLKKEHEEAIRALRRYMEHKRYSRSTVKNYLAALTTFLKHTGEKDIRDIGEEDVIGFVHSHILRNRLSQSYQNILVSALKLMFREVFHTRLDTDRLERPRREKRLPNVLSKEEVKRILEAPGNLKHRTMLAMLYGCGLRRSELLNLRLEDVAKDRRVLFIRQSKGKKDRLVPLSPKLLDMLEEYCRAFRPVAYVFEGQYSGTPYSTTSIEKVLSRACVKAGIGKPVTLHWLRHSYATHLLESGVDLRYIQELLGHQSSRTTEIYTHVSFKSLQNIKSPFDDL